MKFNWPDKAEAQKIITRYLDGERNTLAQEIGCSLSTLRHNMVERYGIRVSEHLQEVNVGEAQTEPEIILPELKIREYKEPKRQKGDEEEQGLICGDGHAGKITPTFNKNVYRDRMYKMFESTLIITELHRKMYPIRKLRILNVGDNIQGENPFQGSKLEEVECGARTQTAIIALPVWYEILCSFRQHFVEVTMDCFPGNHGHDRLAPETSREDLRLYDLLSAKLGNQKGITIRTHEKFGDIVDIMGFRFFCTHLDGISCQNGIPYFAIKRRLDSWYIQYGGFNYAVGGHFHKRGIDEGSSRYEFIMNSTLVSDDMWALKKLGISSSPSQWTFGVHPRHGMTWRYPLIVDDKFLPEPITIRGGK